ncbi:hypothetical protein [Aeromicrobium sp.]|uniref:hypothetical protein n=1 Tax=Aeromicrobium sp. TaxID=1871063 RepID=UPI0030C2A54F
MLILSTQKDAAGNLGRFKTKAEIIRCLKRLLAREIWAHMRPLREPKKKKIDLILAA